MAQSIRRGYCFVKYLYYLIHYNVNKNKFSLEQPLSRIAGRIFQVEVFWEQPCPFPKTST